METQKYQEFLLHGLLVLDALPGWPGITILPCWDGVGEFITTPHLRACSMPLNSFFSFSFFFWLGAAWQLLAATLWIDMT